MLTASSLRTEIENPPEVVANSILKFFSRPEEQLVEEQITLRDGTHETRTTMHVNPMPTIEEWCVQHRMSRHTLESYAKSHPLVAEAIEFAKGAMKVYLIKNGLSGRYDARIVTFVASNETDMKIKAETTVTLKQPHDILDEIEKGEIPIIEGKVVMKKVLKQPKQLSPST